ncbi:hypothetical protein ACPCYV_47870, partial [Streptomyces mordarskii]
LRGYQEAVRLFCDYATDPAYEWASECERRFGTHPIQVCHEWKCATRRWCAVRRGESKEV